MKLKDGIIVNGMRPEILLAIYIIEPILLALHQELIITEICGGKHSTNSKHYLGCAIDIRTWVLTENGTIDECAKLLQSELGREYYVPDGGSSLLGHNGIINTFLTENFHV